MYSAVGTTLILQPDSAHTFVREPDHPMLPPGPGLYTLRPPSRLTMQVCAACSQWHAASSRASRSSRVEEAAFCPFVTYARCCYGCFMQLHRMESQGWVGQPALELQLCSKLPRGLYHMLDVSSASVYMPAACLSRTGHFFRCSF